MGDVCTGITGRVMDNVGVTLDWAGQPVRVDDDTLVFGAQGGKWLKMVSTDMKGTMKETRYARHSSFSKPSIRAWESVRPAHRNTDVSGKRVCVSHRYCVIDTAGPVVTLTSASMSSLYNHKYKASNVLDGKSNTFCHTKKGRGQWLRVFLTPARLAHVQITNRQYNRQHCCRQRLGTFDLKFQGTNSDWRICQGSPYTWNMNGPQTQSFKCNTGGVQAKAIEIKQHGNDYLNLAGVKVVGSQIIRL